MKVLKDVLEKNINIFILKHVSTLCSGLGEN